MQREFVNYEIDESVATVTVNRPPVNAIDHQTLAELGAVFDELFLNERVRAVIFTGGGKKAFIAGADISVILGLDRRKGMKFSQSGHDLTLKIEHFPVPVICAINGLALGGGLEFAMACDIRIASEKARLGVPEIKLGAYPGAGGTQRLPRLIGKGKAKELLFTGDDISAEEAYRIGLVEKVVPEDQVLPEAMKMAQKISEMGPIAVQLAKKVINQGIDVPLRHALDLEAEYFGELCATEDMKEGAKAFLEKRAPNFRGR